MASQDPALERWLQDASQRFPARLEETHRYVLGLARVTRELAAPNFTDTPDSWKSVELFHIKLHSVLEDLYEPVKKRAEVSKAFVLTRSTGARTIQQALIDCVVERFDILSAMRDALSFEQRAGIRLLRNYASHTGIESDGLRFKGGKLKDSITVCGRTLSIEELDDLRNRLAENLSNELEGAKHVARIIREYVDQLFATYEREMAIHERVTTLERSQREASAR